MTVAIVLLFCLPRVSRAGSPPSVWTVLDPLKAEDTRPVKSLEPIRAWGWAIDRALFHRKIDTNLHRFFDQYTESFSNLDVSSLYYAEKINWDEVGAGSKTISFRGERRDGSYYFNTRRVTEPLKKVGSTTNTVTVRQRDDAYLLSTFRRANMGTFGETTSMSIMKRTLELFDFRSFADTDTNDTRLLQLYERRIETDLPQLKKFLNRIVSFHSIGRFQNVIGTDTKVSRVTLTYTLDGESLEDRFPELYRVYNQTLLPSGLRVFVSDERGRRLFRYERNGRRVEYLFFTKDGRILPFLDGAPISTEGFTPMDMRRMNLTSEVSSYMTMFGLYFGMSDLTFRSKYENGVEIWTIEEAPELNLPWGLRLLFSPFLQPFLSHLETGNKGRGITYRETFSPGEHGLYHVQTLDFPLRNSPIVPFLLKLYNLAWQPYDTAAQTELHRFGKAFGNYLKKDFKTYENRVRRGEVD